MQYNFNGNRDLIRKWALRGATAVGGFAVLALAASLLLPEKADLAQAQQNRPTTPQQPAAQPAAPAAQPQNIRNFEDWALLCERPQGATRDACMVFQQIAMNSGQRLLLTRAGQPGADGAARLSFSLPLGSRIATGIAVKVDENQQFSANFAVCLQEGCLAEVPLDAGLLNQLSNGKQAVLAFLDHGNGQQINVTISLKGFANAYKALPAAPPLAGARAPATTQPAAAAPPAGQRPAAPANQRR